MCDLYRMGPARGEEDTPTFFEQLFDQQRDPR